MNLEVLKNYGFSAYSARYGNIYTVHQLLQLFNEAYGLIKPIDYIWRNKEGKYIDAFRPSVEPFGLGSEAEVAFHRQKHLQKVRTLFENMNYFIFTLGLTEGWINKSEKTVYPVAPEIMAGDFDEKIYEFKNYNYNEIYSAFVEFKEKVEKVQNQNTSGLKFILTVSPVPLTATASNSHILLSTVYSKSVLRAVAGDLTTNFSNIDYFPSYEIITNPNSRGIFYEPNLRSVTQEGVDIVMKAFFKQHQNSNEAVNLQQINDYPQDNYDPKCEEYLLNSFSP